MSKNLILLAFLLFSISFGLQAQTVEELKAQKTVKADQLAALQTEIDDLTARIDEFPGWKIGGVGLIGFNALGNNNWYSIGTPNSKNNALNLGFSGYANQDEEKHFWRSLLNINLSRSTTFADKNNAETKVIALTNGLDLSSLFGYKLNSKWAVSVEGKWISSLLEFDPKGEGIFDDEYKIALNNPGQATLSAGVTWTPINNLVVLIHPLGYQKNWPGEFISSAGAKIGATYAAEIVKGISWSSNLSAFIPYGNGDGFVDHVDADNALLRQVSYETSDLMNWTWINGFSFSVWKGIGVSFNLGLRGDQQVANLGKLKGAADQTAIDALDVTENPLQSYYTLGLSYTF